MSRSFRSTKLRHYQPLNRYTRPSNHQASPTIRVTFSAESAPQLEPAGTRASTPHASTERCDYARGPLVCAGPCWDRRASDIDHWSLPVPYTVCRGGSLRRKGRRWRDREAGCRALTSRVGLHGVEPSFLRSPPPPRPPFHPRRDDRLPTRSDVDLLIGDDDVLLPFCSDHDQRSDS